jgi:predicted dienelactone hydrolase
MATIILSIAVVIEAAFATYCIVTKSNQRMVRNFIRIGALAAFVLLALVSVFHWGFHWYGLATLLLVWAVLGAWALIRKKAENNEYRTRRIIRLALRTLLLVFVAIIPALVFPQNKLPPMTGTHPVATVNYTYTDQNRIETFTNTGENREVNVEFWYPDDGGGPYPLVVFSHGTSALKLSNTSTFMDLASNGYVVCSIDHPYHSLFTIDATGKRTMIDNAYMQEYLNAANGKYDAATNYKLNHEWMALRIADINFVLDTILANIKDTGSGAVYQLIDPEKIGLMGHSLGGESSAQVARERNDIGAVVNLDADMAGEYVDFVNGREVLNDTVYPVPILTILSDTLVRLIAAVPDANDVIAVKHVTATAPNAFEVDLPGTDHMSVTDLPLISPLLVWLINTSVPQAAGGHAADALFTVEKMNDLVLQFFNVYLKGEGSFTPAGTY